MFYLDYSTKVSEKMCGRRTGVRTEQFKDELFSGGFWIIIHLMGQVVPFMFFSYYIIFSLDIFVPMQGRSDPSMNPDLLIAVSLFGLTLLMGGLLIPTLTLFKQSVYIVCTFLVIFLAFVICMATPLGFAYKTAVSAERFWIFVRICAFLMTKNNSISL